MLAWGFSILAEAFWADLWKPVSCSMAQKLQDPCIAVSSPSPWKHTYTHTAADMMWWCMHALQDKKLDPDCRRGCANQHSRGSWKRGADWNRRPLQDCSLLHRRTNKYWKANGYFMVWKNVLESMYWRACIGENVLERMYWRNLWKIGFCHFQCWNVFLACGDRMSIGPAMDALRTAPPAWPFWFVCVN